MFEATSGAMWPSKRSDPTQSTPGWGLWMRGQTGGPTSQRSFTRHANHARRMTAVPEVFMGLNAIDLLVTGPLCVSVQPANVTATGMDVRFTTRNSSLVWSAGAAWLAFVPTPGGVPPAMQTGRVLCDANAAGYRLHEAVPAGAGGGPREHVCRVAFPRPFDARNGLPVVVPVVAGLCAPARAWLRLRVGAADVRPDGFTLHVTTWGDSTLDQVTVAWLAYSADVAAGAAGGRIVSSAVPCMNTSPAFSVAVGKGPRDFVQRAGFGPVPFVDDPEVVTFLSGMEISTRTDVRLKAVERARTRAGCDLVFGTWADTSVLGGDITWIAFLDSTGAAAHAGSNNGFGGGNGMGAPAGVRDASGRRANFAPVNQPVPPMGGMQPGPGGLEPGMECVVCFERPKDTILQPCNHICVCSYCAQRLAPPICPVCRTGIAGMAKIYFA